MAVIERDVIIVGAGPAGSICAAYLAKAGLDVLLLDKDIFPRDRVCGDMLREGIVEHIGALEAVTTLDKKSTCIRNIKIMSNAGLSAVVPFECYALPRYELDKLLVETAVSWGAEFRQGCRVTDVITDRGVVRGVKTDFRGHESEIRARMVIGADGASSVVAKSLGIMKESSSGIWLGQRAYFKGIKLDKTLAKDQYDAYGIFAFDAGVAPGYFWILPVGEKGVSKGICNVGVVIKGRDTYKGKSLTERFDDWLERNPQIKAMFANAEQIGEWKGGKLTDESQGILPQGEGYMLIGDAASTMEGLFNDGLSAAANTAKSAADALLGHKGMPEALRAGEMSKSTAEVEAPEDAAKLKALLIESLHDPATMDMIVERMERDPSYMLKNF